MPNGDEVICDKSIAVPENPLSYRCNGARNNVTPIALIVPASNNIPTLSNLNCAKYFFNLLPHYT